MTVLMLAVVTATVGYGVSFPLLAITLENMQVSNGLIGLNASMPALGWIAASLLMPWLHTRYSTRKLMLAFLSLSMLGLIGFAFVKDFSLWLLFRLLFGGGLGMFFRTLEYHLNFTSSSDVRGRVLGIYLTCFLGGIIIGSVLQPELGIESIHPYGLIFACLIASSICISLSGLNLAPDLDTGQTSSLSFLSIKSFFVAVPIAAAGALTYGLIESIPAYLMPIYALKTGFDESTAAYTFTAFAAGNILFAFPLGMLSDKIGRALVMYGCVVVSGLGMLALPFFDSSASMFLSILFVFGGCLVGIYSMSLSIIGDNFSQSRLIYINAMFGILYACGSLVGPVIHGVSMQLYDPHGMIISTVAVLILFLVFVINKRGLTSGSRI